MVHNTTVASNANHFTHMTVTAGGFTYRSPNFTAAGYHSWTFATSGGPWHSYVSNGYHTNWGTACVL